ncbi:MAG: NAD-dependent epimerase, partial [Flavobacteriales bacterium]|nr:NAD-dependent epimerase [Flavobacteriales bacterium]
NVSMMEARALCEEITGNRMDMKYSDQARIGDHIWYVSDVRKFQEHYPEWTYRYGLKETLVQIFEEMTKRMH